jgi:hypothetical protein
LLPHQREPKENKLMLSKLNFQKISQNLLDKSEQHRRQEREVRN